MCSGLVLDRKLIKKKILFGSYVPAYHVNRDNIAIAHFIGTIKPWHSPPPPSNSPQDKYDLVQQWWNVYNRYYGEPTVAPIAPSVPATQPPASPPPTTTTGSLPISSIAPPAYDPAVPPPSQVQPVFPWEQTRASHCTRVWYD